MVFDVTEQDFEQKVLVRSRELPVVVDFWAEWCGPCRTLTPALEAAAKRREGAIELAKLDTDTNPGISQAFGIRGIPAVKAFRDGGVVDEFTGAIPPAQVEAFFDKLVPSEADSLAASDDEESLRRALELDPRQAEAAQKLGRMLLARGDREEAAGLLEGFPGDFVAEGLATRARIELEDGELEPALAAAFSAADEGDSATALERLQEALESESDQDHRDAIRRLMVGIFTELGADHPLAREHRRRLAAALT